jgi:hypothetical protein
MIEHNAPDPNIVKKLETGKLEELLEAFTSDNRKMVLELFYKTAKLLYTRQLRTKNKPFKRKEVAFIVDVTFYHHVRQTVFDIREQQDLRTLLNKHTDENKAQGFYRGSLAGRKIIDSAGREILIKAERIDCIYKDEENKKHSVASKFFCPYRAKRLPWIIPILENSKEIYFEAKPEFKCDHFFYVGTVTGMPSDVEGEMTTNYHIVLVRRKHGMKELEFVTTYPIFGYWDYLKHLDKWAPLK